jgi:hypothetical protein
MKISRRNFIHSDPRWELLLEKLGLVEYWREMSPV